MNFNFANTFDNQSSQPGMTNSKLGLSFTSRKNNGFGYDFSYSRVGKNYNPELGFELRENYYRFGDKLWWAWVPNESSRLLNHQVYFKGWGVWKNNTNDIESAQAGPGWQFNTKKGYFGDFSVTSNHENLVDTFELGDDAFIPINKYEFLSFQGIFNTPFNYKVNLENMLTLGNFFDGTQFVLGISPAWRVKETSLKNPGRVRFRTSITASPMTASFLGNI